MSADIDELDSLIERALGAGKPLSDLVWNAEDAAARNAAEFCYHPQP